jgi:hypothetical protein
VSDSEPITTPNLFLLEDLFCHRQFLTGDRLNSSAILDMSNRLTTARLNDEHYHDNDNDSDAIPLHTLASTETPEDKTGGREPLSSTGTVDELEEEEGGSVEDDALLGESPGYDNYKSKSARRRHICRRILIVACIIIVLAAVIVPMIAFFPLIARLFTPVACSLESTPEPTWLGWSEIRYMFVLYPQSRRI